MQHKRKRSSSRFEQEQEEVKLSWEYIREELELYLSLLGEWKCVLPNDREVHDQPHFKLVVNIPTLLSYISCNAH